VAHAVPKDVRVTQRSASEAGDAVSQGFAVTRLQGSFSSVLPVRVISSPSWTPHEREIHAILARLDTLIRGILHKGSRAAQASTTATTGVRSTSIQRRCQRLGRKSLSTQPPSPIRRSGREPRLPTGYDAPSISPDGASRGRTLGSTSPACRASVAVDMEFNRLDASELKDDPELRGAHRRRSTH
jgi:hypothetical protein